MRFAPESEHGANAGLSVARDLLEKVKKQFPAISYADLWSLVRINGETSNLTLTIRLVLLQFKRWEDLPLNGDPVDPI